MPDADADVNDNQAAHASHMKEREALVDAAREATRTFDQAVLAFGSAVFGASIAFVKDVAPNPQSYSLKWLGCSWVLFSLGLLSVMLSFQFSHRACMFEIDEGAKALGNSEYQRRKNWSSSLTAWCNYCCVVLLFVGLLSWSWFAYENLAQGENTLNNPKGPQSPPPSDVVKKGYIPPRTPPPPPPKSPPPSPPPANK